MSFVLILLSLLLLEPKVIHYKTAKLQVAEVEGTLSLARKAEKRTIETE